MTRWPRRRVCCSAKTRAAAGGAATTAGEEPAVAPHKPIWEEIQELTAGIPDEVWDKLSTDLSEQHDHYIYRHTKRPVE